jgi:hypothetical protein
MIWKLYKYVYYKLYSWAFNLQGENNNPEYTSLFTLSFLSGLNILGINFLIISLFDIDFIPIEEDTRFFFILGWIVWGILHFFSLIFRKKYKRIATEFENEKNKTLGTVFIWLYIFGSFAFVICSAILSKK